MPSGSTGARPVLPLVAALVLCVAAAPATRADPRGDAVRRALFYLQLTQVKRPLDVTVGGLRVRDEPGDWPQRFRLAGSDGFAVRDVSPFTVAFIHHALTAIDDADPTLGLGPGDVERARALRRRAAGFLRRFESPPGSPDAGTFGFWPPDTDPDRPRPLTEALLMAWLQGPILGGDRVPLNLVIYPAPMAVPTDADVTAAVAVALRDDARLDGGPEAPVPLAGFVADWRDLGEVPLRRSPDWLPPASGAFLTWLAYTAGPPGTAPNDVDLVVNANVLFALGRLDRLDTPGVADAVALIDAVVAAGVHRDEPESITEYYPDNLAFRFAVSRAYGEGGVWQLGPAVEILADEVEASAIHEPDGTAHWDLGAPQLDTAFAVLTLVHAGRGGELVDAAVAYLIREQGALGGYDEATFFVARADGGQVFEFSSRAFTTAMVLEAIVRADGR